MIGFKVNSLLLLAAILLAACHPGRPGYVLSEGKMERVLYDYHVAQAMADYSPDSADYRRYVYVQKVFEKHGITEEEFDSSMIWYSTNTGKLYTIYDHLHDRFEAEAMQAGAGASNDVYASLTAEGDTANIWMGDKMLVLQQATLDNSRTFAYVTDTMFHRGDEFLFHGRTFFFQRDGQREAVVSLTVHYAGDSVASEVRYVRGDADFDVRLTANRKLDIKGVSGFVYFPASENRDGTPRRLFVFNPVLVRIHHGVTNKQKEPELIQEDECEVEDSMHVESSTTENITDGTVVRNHKVDSVREALREKAKRQNGKKRISSRKARR